MNTRLIPDDNGTASRDGKTVGACLRYGDVVADSPDHVEMEREKERLWNGFQSAPTS